MPDFGLQDHELAAITGTLKQNRNIHRAVIFGSRAKGNHRPYSDIDIALYGDVEPADVEDLICRLDELPTAYTFDVTSYASVNNAALRDHIDRVGVEIYKQEE